MQRSEKKKKYGSTTTVFRAGMAVLVLALLFVFAPAWVLPSGKNTAQQASPSSALDVYLVVGQEDTQPPPPVDSENDESGSSGQFIQYPGPLAFMSLVIAPTQTTAEVRWQTSKPALSTVSWGTTPEAETGAVSEASYTSLHSLTIANLVPNTRYYIVISAEAFDGETVHTSPTSFSTLGAPEEHAPVNVSDFRARAVQGGGEASIKLDWDNPMTPFKRIRVVRSNIFFPKDPKDGQVVYEGTGESIVDRKAEAGTTYYYAAFTEGADGTYSSGALALVSVGVEDTEEQNVPGDMLEHLPDASSTPESIEQIGLGDFTILQDGRITPFVPGGVAVIDALRPFSVLLPYEKAPEALKTISVTLTNTRGESSSFLLRVNADASSYSATLAPLVRAGRYQVKITMLDRENKMLQRLHGAIYARAIGEAPVVTSAGPDTISILKAGLLLLGLLLALVLVVSRRKPRTEAQPAVLNA